MGHASPQAVQGRPRGRSRGDQCPAADEQLLPSCLQGPALARPAGHGRLCVAPVHQQEHHPLLGADAGPAAHAQDPGGRRSGWRSRQRTAGGPPLTRPLSPVSRFRCPPAPRWCGCRRLRAMRSRRRRTRTCLRSGSGCTTGWPWTSASSIPRAPLTTSTSTAWPWVRLVGTGMLACAARLPQPPPTLRPPMPCRLPALVLP